MTTADNNFSLPTEDQTLISQYLDGELNDEQAKLVRERIENDTEWRQCYQQLKTLSLNIATSDTDLAVSGDLWQSISGQISQDSSAHLLPVDEEFISAYYDNEVASDAPERHAFEAQLYQNNEANRVLGNVQVISETVRQFSYRLEENCTIDIAQSVMVMYQEELNSGTVTSFLDHVEAIELPEVSEDMEQLSAYIDGELAARDTMSLNARMENGDTEIRKNLSQLQAVQDRFVGINRQFMEQISDDSLNIWAAIEADVSDHIKTSKKVLPFAKVSPVKKWGALSAVAAAALLLVTTTQFAFFDMGLQQPLGGNNLNQLASLPESTKPFAVDRVDGMDNMPKAADSEVQSNQMAIYNNGQSTSSPSDNNAQKLPSSDAYLFQTLKEDMGDDELGVLLGI